MVNKLGIVTGIKLEDKLLRAGFANAGFPHVLTACAAGTVSGAQSAAQSLIDQGANHLLSFGVCGGLAPHLKPGGLIVANSVSMAGETLSLISPWKTAVMAQIAGLNIRAQAGQILSVTEPITCIEAKKAAFENTRAVAVDVESFAVAKIARAHKIHCLVLRAVLDSAVQTLPKAALKGVNAAGETQILPVIMGLLKRPQDLPDLMNLGRDSSRAQDTLRAVIKKGAPDFWAP